MPKDKSLLTIFYPEENISFRRRNDREISVDNIIAHILSASHIPQNSINFALLEQSTPLINGSQNSMNEVWAYSPPGNLELVKLKRRSSKWIKISFIIFVLSLIFLLGGVCLYQNYFLPHYGAVFDAGSAHTSLSIYKWHHKYLIRPETELPFLMHEEITQTMECESSSSSGVSSYIKHPRNVRSYITESSCFNHSKTLVPKGSHIFFGATAGMRILKASKPRIAKAIMSNITQALSDFKNVNASIISGVDEGIYGWITVNFLSNSFLNKTLGALDWGGASSQITFELKEDHEKYEDHIRPMALFNRNFSLFVRSDLCYGKYEALKRYLSMLVYSHYIKKGYIPEEIASPCHIAGRIYSHQELVNSSSMFTRPCTFIKDEKFLKIVQKLNFTLKGSGNFEKCQHLIISEAFNFKRCTTVFTDHCIDPQEIPSPLGRNYIAFSTYYYYLQSLNMLPSIPEPQVYLNIMKGICEKDNSIIRTSPNSCFEGLFLHSLLKVGYHFDDWSKRITALQKIKNKEVGWTLGYIIHRSTIEEEYSLLPFPVFAISMMCLIILLVILIIHYLYSQCCSYSARTYRPLIAL